MREVSSCGSYWKPKEWKEGLVYNLPLPPPAMKLHLLGSLLTKSPLWCLVVAAWADSYKVLGLWEDKFRRMLSLGNENSRKGSSERLREAIAVWKEALAYPGRDGNDLMLAVGQLLPTDSNIWSLTGVPSRNIRLLGSREEAELAKFKILWPYCQNQKQFHGHVVSMKSCVFLSLNINMMLPFIFTCNLAMKMKQKKR